MATPSAFEQLTVELINQARLNPHGEYHRFVTNAQPNVLSAMNFFNVDRALLASQFAALVPVAPVAWNDSLGNSSDAYSALMLTRDTQSHTLDGLDLIARFGNGGYANATTAAENIFAFAQDAVHAHAGFFIDWGGNVATGGIQSPPGHRNAIMNASYTELGVGHVVGTGDGSGPDSPVGPNLVTHHLANRSTYTSQIVGVIFNDADGDRFYDIGEGVAGATVAAGAMNANGFSTGGYNLDLAAGAHSLNFSSALGAASITVTLGASNIKVDMFDPGAFRSSVSATLGAGGVALELLGEAAISATGNGGANTLIGNVGNNVLDGGAGTDVAVFSGPRSAYSVAAVSGGVVVTDTRPGAPDGSDTLIGVENVSFAGTVFATASLVPATAQVLIGDAAANALVGGGANDTLDGRGSPLVPFLGALPAQQGQMGAEWRVAAAADYTGDGVDDVMWVRTTTGDAALWTMRNGALQAFNFTQGHMGAEWRAISSDADFNGDGRADLVWERPSVGDVAIWSMNGPNLAGFAQPAGRMGAEWKVSGTGDFDGDGRSDILWTSTTGQINVWLMNGTQLRQAAVSNGQLGPDWKVAAVDDFTGDGKADIVYLGAAGTGVAGQIRMLGMNGASVASVTTVGAMGAEWRVAGSDDITMDGKADLVWARTNGTAQIWEMNGAAIVRPTDPGGAMGAEWKLDGVGDFTGDGRSDFLWTDAGGRTTVFDIDSAGDALTGGAGSDTFIFRAMGELGDTITDFTPGADRLDLSGLFDQTGYGGQSPLADGAVRLIQNGASAELQVDQTFGQREWLAVATLQNVNAGALTGFDFIA